jgi:hypothetical protein
MLQSLSVLLCVYTCERGAVYKGRQIVSFKHMRLLHLQFVELLSLMPVIISAVSAEGTALHIASCMSHQHTCFISEVVLYACRHCC